jgi:hypothetical protein
VDRQRSAVVRLMPVNHANRADGIIPRESCVPSWFVMASG